MRIILSLVLLSFCHSIFAQQYDIPTLEKQLQSVTSDTAKWSATRELHNAWFKSDPEKSKYYAQELLVIANRLDSAKLKYKAYSALSRCEKKKRNYALALKLDSIALQFATQSGFADDIFSATMSRANGLIDAEQYSKGNEFLNSASKLAIKNNSQEQTASVNYSLGIVSAELQQKRKGIEFLSKALNAFTLLNKPRQIAETQTRLAEYHLDLCNTDSAIAFINQALDYYNSVTPKLYNESFAKSIFARGYAANGNFNNALETYSAIKEVYIANNNFTEYALTCVDMGGILLNQKSFSKAKALFTEAEKQIIQNNYEPALPLIEMSWGEYYSFTGDSVKANVHFAKAVKQANKVENVQIKIELKRKLAEHAYRFKNRQKGDLLLLEYASEMSEQVEQEELECLLNRIKEKNSCINNEEWNNIKLLYTKGGAEKLKALLNNKTLSQIVPVDTLLSLNPYSNAIPAYDSALNIFYNKQLQEIETKYRTKAINDSLEYTRNQLVAAKQRSLAIIIAVVILASAILFFLRSKQKIEKQKALLKQGNEIRQRILRDLHDEIGAGLTQISMICTRGKVDLQKQISVEPTFDSITDESIKLGKNLTGILWTTNPENDNLESLFIKIRTYSNEFLENSTINLHLNLADEMDSFPTHPEANRNLFLILKEALNNIVKHSNATHVNIEFSVDTFKKFKLVIADNGKGFDATASTNGNGKKILEQRAASIKNGSIEIMSEFGKGTTIVALGNLS